MSMVDDADTVRNEEDPGDWCPEPEPWEPDGLDDPSAWLPTDSWFDRQAEIFESMHSDVADFAAAWFRRTARDFRALDAATVAEFEARSATYAAEAR